MSDLLRVLVVDDVPAVVDLHARFVNAHPRCEVVGTTASGADAVAAVRSLAPDLVLLDIYMPGLSGIDVLRELRADSGIRQPDVIAVTAARDVDTVRDARMMGARHYLVKPFTALELHERIDDVLRDRASLADASKPLDQRGVDNMMHPPDRRPLPKGLSPETLALVVTALERLGESGAGVVAETIGLSRVSCRRYLEHLASSGAAERALDYNTSGRPGTRYRLVASHAHRG